MKHDFLVYALCVLLVLFGVGIGLVFTGDGDSIFNAVLSGGWLQFFLGVIVTYYFSKGSEKVTERNLRYQELVRQGVDVGVVRDAKGKSTGLTQDHSIVDSLSATGYVDSIIMTRTVEKADP